MPLLPRNLVLALLLLSPAYSLFAETEQQKVEAMVLHQDALFWAAYNRCDTEGFRPFISTDVEFYHDKGGVILGLDSLIATTKKNLCADGGYRLRREAVEGSINFFPLQNGDAIYGAVLSGEHRFYVLEKGKKERLDGQAKFFDVWLVKDSAWKMSRVVSYSHGPAEYVNKRTEAKVPANVLDRLAGAYAGAHSGAIVVYRKQEFLVLQIQDKKYLLYPESENQFFTKDRDLTFEFVKNENSQVPKIVIRESGEIVETAEASH
jgi:Domain of unknown function (DUF4440)/Domain of unknown function (DUF3471)